MSIQDSTKHGAAVNRQSDPEAPEKARISGGRRALLKGSAAAVPMVLTLRSGAALAITSAESCVLRASSSVSPTVITPDTGDNLYVRTAVQARQLQAGNGDPFVPNSDSPFFVFMNPASGQWENEAYWNGSDSVRRTYIDDPSDSAKMKDADTSVTLSYSIVAPVSGSLMHYVLVKVTDTGDPRNGGARVRVATGDSGMLITTSCWNSANGVANAFSGSNSVI